MHKNSARPYATMLTPLSVAVRCLDYSFLEISHLADFAIKIFHRIIRHNGKSNEILHNYIFNGLVGQRMLLPFFKVVEKWSLLGVGKGEGRERDIRYSFIYFNNKIESAY